MPTLTDPDDLRELCRRFGVRPSASAGQNFLVDGAALSAAVAAGELTLSDVVLEVGPGFGTLTQALAPQAGRVVAIEADPTLAAAARELLASHANVSLHQGNALRLDWLALGVPDGFKAISNLPYGITGRFLRRLLTEVPRPQLAVLMVQREVAERMTTPPGKMSMLSVLCQLHADMEIVASVPRKSFWPVPAVDSAIVRLRLRSLPELATLCGDGLEAETVLRVCKIGFASRRKTLTNNLRAWAALSSAHRQGKMSLDEMIRSCDLTPNARAQELTVPQWITLAKKVKNYLN
ncbi:MAG: 16S rRNA (adenine1518-N6/adenine1519-N6)-dimethyltransferase [Parcubacteria group bacterium Gr01-1014_31]|nr:MAG: 16S rRNA (adenine1518-N6/adenine1519-N6)-dimethyltransferase [Parcubacteria group bacterium Gr01-1014_31]